MEVCYWALLFMPPVILHHLLNVFVQLSNKRELKKIYAWIYDFIIVIFEEDNMFYLFTFI
jgi:hypothetical protein